MSFLPEEHYFQINDIVLDIPPEYISISKVTGGASTPILRSRTAPQNKSQFTQIQIDCSVKFCGSTTNGYNSLLNLISQFRVTPICFVDNKLIRDTVIKGSKNNMALILRGMQITKDSEDGQVDVISVAMSFFWFNYFPFSKTFSFKQDVFLPIEVMNPQDSRAWKRLYQAEQLTHVYLPVKQLSDSFPTTLSFNQYKLFKGDQFDNIKKIELNAETLLQSARKVIDNKKETDTEYLMNQIKSDIRSALGTEQATEEVVKEIFGNVTSMRITPTETLTRYQTYLANAQSVTGNSLTIGTWQTFQSPDGVSLGMYKISAPANDTASQPKNILGYRPISIDSNTLTSSLITRKIVVTFTPSIAVIPLAGHTYPTYQYMGNLDISTSINMLCNDETALKEIALVLSLVEEQSLKAKRLPQRVRNIHISDQVINMCGLYSFSLDASKIENIPGSPGLMHIALDLTHNDIDINDIERLTQEGGYITPRGLRNAIAKTLSKSIKVSSNGIILKEEDRTYRMVETVVQGIPTQVRREDVVYSLKRRRDEIQAKLSQITAASRYAPMTGLASAPGYQDLLSQLTQSTFMYSGKNGSDEDLAFKSLCLEFIAGLDRVLDKLIDAINTRLSTTQIEFRNDLIDDIMSLDDRDIFGVELLQKALQPYLSQVVPKLSAQKFATQNNTLEDYKTMANTDVSGAAGALDSKSASMTKDDIDAMSRATPELHDEMFIQKYFDEWITNMNNLMKKIAQTDLINLPQFKDIKEKLSARMLSNNQGLCYKDFPLDQVMRLLDQDTDPMAKSMMQGLKDAAKKSNLDLRNISLTAMLNPDYYFYDNTLDILTNIVDPGTLKDVSEKVIKTYTESRIGAEQEWFQKYYATRFIDQKTQQAVNSTLTDKEKNKSFWNRTDAKSQAFYDYWNNSISTEGYFTPNTLYGKTQSSLNDYDPIALKPIDATSVAQNYTTSMRPATTLSVAPHTQGITHSLSPDSLSPSSGYAQVAIDMMDPNKTPMFDWPTMVTDRRVTCQFGPRKPPTEGASSNHKGIDICSQAPGQSLGHPVLAAADGDIIYVTPFDDINGEIIPRSDPHAGNYIKIKHANGWTTKYLHLHWDPIIEDFSRQFAVKQATRENLYVKRGERIASIGNSGVGTAAHLHFETWQNGTAIDPLRVVRGEFNKLQGISLADIKPEDSILSKSAAQLEEDIKKGHVYGLRRAYPSFRLYFVESDLGERKYLGVDELFSYAAVSDIQIIRNKKIAADLLVITLSNITGILTSNRVRKEISIQQGGGVGSDTLSRESLDKRNADTEYENPMNHVLLQPGIQIQLRLGYNNNPMELETVLNGVIANVAFSETDDVVEIVAQSHGIELVSSVQGAVKKFGGFLSGSGRTGVLLEELLANPEVRHFGRWEPGEQGGSAIFRETLTNRFTIKPQIQDDNIFAPGGRGVYGMFDSTCKYLMYNTTTWDVFQEMTLRHPGYIAAPVPYEGLDGPRMTMFFGLPDQLYFARDPDLNEQSIGQKIKELKDQAKRSVKDDLFLDEFTDETSDVFDDEYFNPESVPVAPQQSRLSEDYVTYLLKDFAKKQDIVKPFRRYHVLTANNHIIYNNIQSDSQNTFNTVTICYSNDNPKEEDDNSSEVKAITTGDPDTFTLRCDGGLMDEDVRELYEEYPNCVGYEMAKQYAVGRLKQTLEAGYAGTLVVIGDPTIKPYDICYIFDEYNDMFGPIEVEQVVDKISHQNGFITEITPSMLVHVNQLSTISTADAMGYMSEAALQKIHMPSLSQIQDTLENTSFTTAATAATAAGLIGAGILTGAGGAAATVATAAAVTFATISDYAFAPIANAFFNTSERTLGQGANTSVAGLVGAFVFRKLITRSQLKHPFRYSPLVKNSRPLLGALPNRKTDGSFITEAGNMIKEGLAGKSLLLDKIEDEWFSIKGYINDRGSFMSSLQGK